MRKGNLNNKRTGCGVVILLALLGLVYAAFKTKSKVNELSGGNPEAMELTNYVVYVIVILFVLMGGVMIFRKLSKNNRREREDLPDHDKRHAVTIATHQGDIILANPFRGIWGIGGAGSGKTESLVIQFLSEFIRKDFAGLNYDLKFPSLANEVQGFIEANGSRLKHFCINLDNPEESHRVNPIAPECVINTSYAREYSQVIINNLLKESIQKPDFWTRSATDLLTACIWYLREEHPEICDLPHVFALVTSPDEQLLKILQTNPQTAQLTISMYNALQRGAGEQLSGVVGTLQGAIAQINTPELMYIFSGSDFSLQLNDPLNPVVLTIGTNPTLSSTFAPLCSLIITVATKLMNQPGKNPSFVLLDELPTVYIPNLDVLPNTGRSNKIAPVFLCQDLAQLADGYTKEKADVLFASCNTHFYGRVASSKTAEVLSRQFGKEDTTFVTASRNKNSGSPFTTKGESETVQERDIYKPSEFMNLAQGEFIGIAVESNVSHFRKKIKMISREPGDFRNSLSPHFGETPEEIYKRVRQEVNTMIAADLQKLTE